MVSKVAVIALVAIVACPILMGYAMNLTEIQETDYKPAGDVVNTTPLLFNNMAYTYAHGDFNKLNTDLGAMGYHKIIPYYENVTNTVTSYPLAQNTYTNQTYNASTQYTNFLYFYEQFDYDPTAKNVVAEIHVLINGADISLGNVNKLHSVSYDKTSGLIDIINYDNNTHDYVNTSYTGDFYRLVLYGSNIDSVYVATYDNNNTYYADFASGFHFFGSYQNWFLLLPNNSRSVLFTMDLNSITNPSYSITINNLAIAYDLVKTTTGGVVSWQLFNHSDSSLVADLYYDPDKTSNTYQFYFEFTKTSEDSTYQYYSNHAEFRYVGDWPTAIGEANTYVTFSDDVTKTQAAGSPELNFNFINFTNPTSNRSPTIRVDDATFRAFEYQVFEDQTYLPYTLRQNPVTTITDVNVYGASITFGGFTYTVKDGNITMGTRQIPLRDLSLSSTMNDQGLYENKIGNTLISTTATPSSIVFNGKWSASIETQTMESYTYTKTEWKAGSFAWNGMDDNFLLCGLVTCLAVFIGCGIYARRSRSGGIIPLMIVTGCAAAVFFIML